MIHINKLDFYNKSNDFANESYAYFLKYYNQLFHYNLKYYKLKFVNLSELSIINSYFIR